MIGGACLKHFCVKKKLARHGSVQGAWLVLFVD